MKLQKGDFIGRDVIERQAEDGVPRTLVGFEMVDKGIARHGYGVLDPGGADEPVGVVTSGTHSPTLAKAIGMAYVPPEHADVGGEIAIDIRGKRRLARIVELPFYSRKKKKTK